MLHSYFETVDSDPNERGVELMCHIENRMHTATHHYKNFYVGHGCFIVGQMQMENWKGVRAQPEPGKTVFRVI